MPLPKIVWRALAGTTMAVTTMVMCGGCGKKGPPLAPLRRNPLPITDLAVAQRGATIAVSFTAPRLSVEGVRLAVLDVTLFWAEQDGDFAKVATRRRFKAAAGERIVQIEPLPPAGTRLRVAVRTHSGSQESPLSPIAGLLTGAPLEPPHDLKAEVSGGNAQLGWAGRLPEPLPSPSPPAASTSPRPSATPTPAPAAPPGFRVYRRAQGSSEPVLVTTANLSERSFADKPPAGAESCYTVRAVQSRDPLVESADSNESCVLVRDVTAPARPSSLVAVPQGAALELIWTAPGDGDIALYRIYRGAPGEAPQRIGEVGQTHYLDEGVTRGDPYEYAVAAVDTAGNEGEKSTSAVSHLP